MEDTEDQDFDKNLTRFRLALGVVMRPLMMYGQQVYVGSAMEEIVSLAVQLHQKLSGIDVAPYHINSDKLH